MPNPLFDTNVRTEQTARCDRCGEPDPSGTLGRCGQCSFWFCTSCHARHTIDRAFTRTRGRTAFCDLVADAAFMHCTMRLSDAEWRRYGHDVTSVGQIVQAMYTDADWDFARRMYCADLWVGARA